MYTEVIVYIDVYTEVIVYIDVYTEVVVYIDVYRGYLYISKQAEHLAPVTICTSVPVKQVS